MAAFSKGLRSLPRGEFICSRCMKFSTTSTAQSGHSRWSKIKHDKGSADAKRSLKNAFFSKEIASASKCKKSHHISNDQSLTGRTDGGPDPNMNPRLAALLVTAKKAGWAKSNMESAIARGQGRSSTGAALESISLEMIMQKTIAIIIEAETDNAKRTLGELRSLVKGHGGVVTPTSYLFKKKGRLSFEKDERNLGVDEVLDEAIEAGAEDVEASEDGSIVVWTGPSQTTSAAEALQKSLGLKIESSDIIWDANEDTKVQLDSGDSVKTLMEFIDEVRDNPNVQGVYANVAQGSLSVEAWDDLQGRLDA
ncbi:putative transcriptional regulatory protein GSU1074 [Lachnellula suecica]|uniref:Putative transcriptional regulatory protein GSU1074 n=1 Tax=Lachnellula suecica TaxID=602035 RepID=A0A8T9BVB2_9HELO|nr:putative transcriptional regulatory protein GSU1074 [Lachnellula suecica]